MSRYIVVLVGELLVSFHVITLYQAFDAFLEICRLQCTQQQGYDSKLHYFEKKLHQLVFMRLLYPGRTGVWSVGFCEGGKPDDPKKNPRSKARTNKLNPHIAPGTESNLGPTVTLHTTLTLYDRQCHKKSWLGGRVDPRCRFTYMESTITLAGEPTFSHVYTSHMFESPTRDKWNI